ncbi:TPA: 1-acyl-sn-glycerol-3-phosphate acyltransferase [candidate division CPR2 bacterium]|uniref:1-acyl-sn-glycerol-3-phosphate acyltransferase n=1 Tax=candidate division CPR2 bacterium GW2011_GWC1_41_48 TaxID=1618344 RepID=A0A0G0YHZ3_UNCC2|nr:MAG: 1-acyl-sn-glycerol-3-phosphate acyltransferase [candidate division CPR2 bacterium GW2011_GWC2_39_35]KKR27645.1 MAG: 1-acyl-sn-glycerol-3-phosphate acyltransferase [candidate division CPR2 bacterium GW2011_GWD1_39_7]KKS09151.1 MAG: 1-acyl-sn-glycerol-3-phosphate acyltransferase [candidate division CPR2 bacterium GW2011_GWC1_41_48]OGB59462.1 MAG: hypothetical protein A2Y27_01165 [candidate division CPR2 bacterium GWD1_39_7]HBG81777.1 1-acyl-sn-glycerol-3-phosphate acyltransferase [candida
MLYRVLKILLSPLIKLFWIERVEGKHNIPRKGPIIIAANHASYLDFAFLGAAVRRRLFFLAADWIYRNPFFRFIMRITGQIKVDRFSKDKKMVYQAAADVLGRGHILVLFPEGTRSYDGKPLKAYRGVARMALQNQVDILPVAIENSHHVFGRHHKFPRIKRICRVKFLEPISYKEIADKTPEEIVHDILMPEIAREIGHEYEHKT